MAVKAAPIVLRASTTTASAFRRIGVACLEHLALNQSILLESRDADALHQVRVGLRRLRAAISIFRRVTADDEQDAIRASLKWMAQQLGPARDLDVLMRNLAEDDPKRLLVREDRQRTYDAVLQTIQGEEWANGLRQTRRWIEQGEWGNSPDTETKRERSVAAHAAKQLDRRYRRLRRDVKGLADQDDETRHTNRIEAKKLRYALEFFESVLDPGKRLDKASSVITGLQEVLGKLNDITVGNLDQPLERADLLRRAGKLAKRFRRLKPFWHVAAPA